MKLLWVVEYRAGKTKWSRLVERSCFGTRKEARDRRDTMKKIYPQELYTGTWWEYRVVKYSRCGGANG